MAAYLFLPPMSVTNSYLIGGALKGLKGVAIIEIDRTMDMRMLRKRYRDMKPCYQSQSRCSSHLSLLLRPTVTI